MFSKFCEGNNENNKIVGMFEYYFHFLILFTMSFFLGFYERNSENNKNLFIVFILFSLFSLQNPKNSKYIK